MTEDDILHVAKRFDHHILSDATKIAFARAILAAGASEGERAYVIAALVAAGHVSRGKVDEAFALARKHAPRPVARDDSKRLDWLREESCDLRCIDVPTGGDDSDVRWIVVQHHMGAPHEREIARSTTDEPRDAIDAAIAKEKHDGAPQ